MNDSELLNWAQMHLKKLHQDLMERFAMEWIDNDGVSRYTLGVSLRDCIRGAIAGEYEDDT